MCGIAGVVSWQGPPDREEVARMTLALAHRGPDGDGFFFRDGVALGHRRLAIIDLEGGKQPLSNETGSVWITFNGEIYNYRELRDELLAKGHRFATQSDTEAIVHAYEEWGDDAVRRLRGMFAFVIVDFDRRRVMMARDHLGIKPLYYRFADGRMTFASEIGAVQAANDPATRLRPEAIEWYLRYRYVPGPGTVFADIDRLPPATCLTFDLNGENRRAIRYWSLEFRADETKNDAAWLQEFEATVRDSVQAHLVADVPFGVFLSGGIDSTLVAAAMRDVLGESVTAFSIGFDEDSFSELRYAEEAAGRLGVALHSETVSFDIADLLPKLVKGHGQPYADTSMIPTWCLARLARRHVPMALSGDGGDEAFAGYRRYASSLRDSWIYEAIGIVRSPWGVGYRSQRLAHRIFRSVANQRLCWDEQIEYFPRHVRKNLWRPEFRRLIDEPAPVFVESHQEAQAFDPLARCQSVDLRTYLPDDILTKVDIASMAHGLEVRPPLVDVKVVEMAARLPMRMRLGENAGQGEGFFPIRPRHVHPWTLKYLPKKSLRDRFGDTFVDRPKKGFGVPEFRWLRPGTPARRLLQELVYDGLLDHWLRRDAILQLIDDHDHDLPSGGLLWGILFLALWRSQNPKTHF